MNRIDMNVLITGGAGFVGKHVILQALKQGFDVHTVVREPASAWRLEALVDQVTVHKGNLSDHSRIEEVFAEVRPAFVIHLAWEGTYNRDRNNSRLQYANNILDAISLFELASNYGSKRFFGLGSQSEYGEISGRVSEIITPQPVTLYGAAKLSVYEALSLLSKQRELPFVWGRLFSTFGPEDNAEVFVSFLCRSLIEGKPLPLTMGEQKWDYLYVEDVAAAICQIAINSEAHGVFNIGSGKPIAINAFVRELKEVLGSSSDLLFGKSPMPPTR